MLRIDQLHELVQFLVVLSLARIMVLGKAITCQYIKKISSQPETISPLAIAEGTTKISAMIVENAKYWETVGIPCMMAWAVSLSPMSETFAKVRTTVHGVHLVQSYGSISCKHQALLEHVIVKTASMIIFEIRATKQPKSDILLPNSKKVAKPTPIPPTWLSSIAKEHSYNSTVTVQICKAPKSE